MHKILFLSLLLITNSAGATGLPEVKVVPYVDLSRYVGDWYEIARYPARFQEGCVGSNATYTLRADGDISVVNRCTDEKNGRLREAQGKAWVVDPQTNAKLKVSFFWPFRGDYWIIDLGKNYEFAVVGTPDRRYLWILSRTVSLDQDLLAGILERVTEQGFDPKKLIRRRKN